MTNAIRVVNRQAQVINLLLWNKAGTKVETKSLLPRQSLEIEADRLSEQVFDLNRHGHVVLTKVTVEKPSQNLTDAIAVSQIIEKPRDIGTKVSKFKAR